MNNILIKIILIIQAFFLYSYSYASEVDNTNILNGRYTGDYVWSDYEVTGCYPGYISNVLVTEEYIMLQVNSTVGGITKRYKINKKSNELTMHDWIQGNKMGFILKQPTPGILEVLISGKACNYSGILTDNSLKAEASTHSVEKYIKIRDFPDGRYFSSIIDMNYIRWNVVINKSEGLINIEEMYVDGGRKKVDSQQIDLEKGYSLLDKLGDSISLDLDSDESYNNFTWWRGRKARFKFVNEDLKFEYYVYAQGSTEVNLYFISYEENYSLFQAALNIEEKLTTKSFLDNYAEYAEILGDVSQLSEKQLAERESSKKERELLRLQLEEERAKEAEEKRLIEIKEQAEKEFKKRESIAKEKAENERKKQERIAREKAEKEEKERKAAERERKKQERIAREKAEKEEKERKAAERERKKQERIAREKAEREEKERQEAAERERKKQEKIAREKAEREENERRAAERERREKERLAKEKAEEEERVRLIEAEIAKLELQKQERLEREKLRQLEEEAKEKERLRLEQLERDRVEKEKLEREKLRKLEAEAKEKERLRLEKLERDRIEKERVIAEKLAIEKAENDRKAIEEEAEKFRIEAEKKRIQQETEAKEKLALQKKKTEELNIQRQVLNDLKNILDETKNKILSKKSRIENIKTDIYELEQQAILEKQERETKERLAREKKLEEERLKQEQIAREKAEKERLRREAEAEQQRLKEIELAKIEAKRIQQEKIVEDIRNNMVWTELNISHLLSDVTQFIELHKSEINLLDFIELFRPVKNIENKLLANSDDINKIEKLENFLLKSKSYKGLRSQSLLDARAKELYELDLSIKELQKILDFSYNTILEDPLNDEIFDLTILYDEFKKEKKYTSKIEVDEIIQKFKLELKRIGLNY